MENANLERQVLQRELVEISWDGEYVGARIGMKSRSICCQLRETKRRSLKGPDAVTIQKAAAIEEKMNSERPIREGDKGCFSIAVLFRMLQESDLAKRYASLSVWRCFRDILTCIFVDWTDADDVLFTRNTVPHTIINHLQGKHTYKDACCTLSKSNDDSSSLTQRLEGVFRSRADGIIDRIHSSMAQRVTTFTHVSNMVLMMLLAWRGFVRKQRYIRKQRSRLLKTQEGLRLYKVFSAWRRFAIYEHLETKHSAKSNTRDVLLASVAEQNRLLEELRCLKSQVDTQQDLNTRLQQKLDEELSSHYMLNLKEPLHDDDEELIHHGIVEFRHISPAEWGELCDEEQARVNSERSDIEQITNTTFCKSMFHMSDAISYPSLTTLSRLGKDLHTAARSITKGEYPKGHYTVVGMRKVTLDEADGAVKKGSGYINKREILLSWGNLRIAEGFPHSDYDIKEYRLTAHHQTVNGKAILLLLHLIVPYDFARDITIDDIEEMDTAQRCKKAAKIVSALGVFEYEALLQDFKDGLQEDSYNLLLAQCFVFEHLNKDMRKKYAQALNKVGVPVPGLLAASIVPSKLEPVGLFQKESCRRRRPSALSRGEDAAEGMRRASRLLGMIPQQARLSFMSDLKAVPSVPPPINTLRLVFQPGVGIQMLGRCKTISQEVQCTIEPSSRPQPVLVEIRSDRRLSKRKSGARRSSVSKCSSIRSSAESGVGSAFAIDEAFGRWQNDTSFDEIKPGSCKVLRTAEQKTQTDPVTIGEVKTNENELLLMWICQMVSFFYSKIDVYSEGVYVQPPAAEDLCTTPQMAVCEDSTSLLCIMKVLYQSKVCYEDLLKDDDGRIERLLRIGQEVGGVMGGVTVREMTFDKSRIMIAYSGLWLDWERMTKKQRKSTERSKKRIKVGIAPREKALQFCETAFADLNVRSMEKLLVVVADHGTALHNIQKYYSMLEGPCLTLIGLKGYMQMYQDIGLVGGTSLTMISKSDLERVFLKCSQDGQMDFEGLVESCLRVAVLWDNSCSNHVVLLETFIRDVLLKKAVKSGYDDFLSLFTTLPVQAVIASYQHQLTVLYRSFRSPTFDLKAFKSFLSTHDILTDSFPLDSALQIFSAVLHHHTPDPVLSINDFLIVLVGIALTRSPSIWIPTSKIISTFFTCLNLEPFVKGS